MTKAPRCNSNGGARPERFRAYLRVIAELQVGKALAPRVDASDIVQETLLRAYRSREKMCGMSEAECLAWLRRILTNTLAGAVRDHRRSKRDLRKEVSLERGVESTTANTLTLATRLSSPSARLRRTELLIRVTDALAMLPREQREAISQRYLQSLGVEEIAEQMGKTRAAVAGLLRRGVSALREALREERTRDE